MFQKLKNIIATLNLETNKIWNQLTIKNEILRKAVKVIIFLISVSWFYSYVGVFKYIHNRPSSIHLSAQSQRASIALNYYKTDMNFFKPRIQRYIKGEGITGVEFPIIYYGGAIMYKLFGFDEIYLRIISLMLVTLGLFFFYLLVDQYIRNNILSVMLAIAVSLSPVLLFYTPNFMPDAPSLGFQLIGWYFFLTYLKTNKTRHLNLFVFAVVLTVLIKATSIIIFIIVICMLILDKLRFFKFENKPFIFTEHLKVFTRIVMGIVVAASWYYYASWLNTHYENESFALKPIMVDNWDAAKEIYITIKNLWVKHYYSHESYILIGISFVGIIVLFKYANKILLTITLLNIIGNMFYVYFFLNQFRWHDYYIIALLPCVFFSVLTFSDLIVRFSDKYFKITQVIFVIILFFNMKEALVFCKKNYTERNTRAIYYWTGDYRAYEDLEPKLRALGIKRTDKFLSAFDNTYCGSLYLIDQIGVNIGDESSAEEIDAYLKNDVIKYLIVNDSARFNKIYPNNLANHIIATHRGLIIYKLRN